MKVRRASEEFKANCYLLNFILFFFLLHLLFIINQEKIARISLEHEQHLVGSPYGRFFVRKLNLGLFRKSVGKWKTWLHNIQPSEKEGLPRLGQGTYHCKNPGLQEEVNNLKGEREPQKRTKKARLGHNDKLLDDILSVVK